MGNHDSIPNLNQFFVWGNVYIEDIRNYWSDRVISMLCSAYGVSKDVVLGRFSQLNNRDACASLDTPINKVVRAYAFIMSSNASSVSESEYHKSI